MISMQIGLSPMIAFFKNGKKVLTGIQTAKYYWDFWVKQLFLVALSHELTCSYFAAFLKKSTVIKRKMCE